MRVEPFLFMESADLVKVSRLFFVLIFVMSYKQWGSTGIYGTGITFKNKHRPWKAEGGSQHD